MLSQHAVSLNVRLTAWMALFLQLFMLTSFTWSPLTRAELIENISHMRKTTLQSAATAQQIADRHRISFTTFKSLNSQLASLTPDTELASGMDVIVPDFTLSPSGALQADKSADKNAAHVASLAQVLNQDGTQAGVRQLAEAKLNNFVNLRASEWLNQFGQAQVGVDFKTRKGFEGTYADVLLPLRDKDEWLFFTQLGGRNHDDRWTGNAGLGMRFFDDDIMYGINAFYDYDFTGKHRRLGLGTELARDFLKLSVNGYLRLGGWRGSHDVSDYNERAANGYDARLEGWLPFHPNLGASLTYERYYGKQVALFDKASRQHNPQALAAEIKYTPIPLLTLSVSHRIGNEKQADTRFNLLLSYRLGESLQKQLDFYQVASTKDLKGSRFDLVNRNNLITLDYQKKRLLWLTLPQSLQVESNHPLTIESAITSQYAIDHLEWDVAALIDAGGKVSDQGAKNIQIVAPAYRLENKNRTANLYPVSVVAVDVEGNRSRKVTTMLEVLAEPASISHIDIVKEDALANGTDFNEVVISLMLENGQVATAVPVSFSTTSRAELSTRHALSDEDGRVTLRVKHTKAGGVPIQVNVAGQKSDFILHFIADANTARIDKSTLTVIENNALANGVAEARIRGRVLDAAGNPIANQQVHFEAEGITLVAPDATTDNDGYFYKGIASQKVGRFSVRATVNDTTATVSIRFMADVATATLTLSTINDNSVADGIAQNRVLITVKDNHANPVPNQVITVAADNGANTSTQQVITNTAGLAEFGVTSTRAAGVTVSVKLGTQEKTLGMQFVGDSATAATKLYNVVTNHAVANGSAKNVVLATIHDKFDNPVSGFTVHFAADNGVNLVDTQATSNAAGEVSTGLTSTQATSADVKLTVNGITQSVLVQFIADVPPG